MERDTDSMWPPSCHLPFPGKDFGFLGPNSLGGSRTSTAPLGVWNGEEAECWDIGLLVERSLERCCLPGLAWEEGELGRKPDGGQLTLRWLVAAGERG